jgi:hypothetical protein
LGRRHPLRIPVEKIRGDDDQLIRRATPSNFILEQLISPAILADTAFQNGSLYLIAPDTRAIHFTASFSSATEKSERKQAGSRN